MSSNSNIADFGGKGNSGVQASQIFGSVNVSQPPTDSDRREEACLQLFRLTADGDQGTYEWYKNRIEDRVENTCQWFLKHENYLAWKKARSGPLLVSADPGCGKSVLAKHLINHELSGTVCYFFFKEMDQNTLRQALCAVLHQLFTQNRGLIKNALPVYSENGPSLINNVYLLEVILSKTLSDPEAGSVIIVLDALDECRESDSKELIGILKRRLPRRHDNGENIKIVLTTRPYYSLLVEFWDLVRDFPSIRIPGEEHSDQIGAEINYVIKHRVSEVAQKFTLSSELEEYLRQRLLGITHRTYLWVYLVFEHLNEGFKKTEKSIQKIIDTLPPTVNDAYERILQRSTDRKKAKRALCIILAASRPLSLWEMNVALSVEDSSVPRCQEDLDLESAEDFKTRLRNLCGLFISVYDAKVYFLHLTAREFLLTKSVSDLEGPSRWCSSIPIQRAHAVLAYSCVAVLSFFQCGPCKNLHEAYLASRECSRTIRFFDYAASYWSSHFQQGRTEVREITNTMALELCRQLEIGTPIWLRHSKDLEGRGEYRFGKQMPRFTPFTLACFLGLDQIVHQLIPAYNQPSLNLIAHNAFYYASNQPRVLRVLVESGMDINVLNNYGTTALHRTVLDGDIHGMCNLLSNGADVESKDKYQRTPLLLTLSGTQNFPISVLVGKGANVNAQDNWGNSLLHYLASRGGRLADFLLLISHGADIELKNFEEQTALHLAAFHGEATNAQCLLDHGALVDERDNFGRTALYWAVAGGKISSARILLTVGADIHARCHDDHNPLSLAMQRRHLNLIRHLLAQGATIFWGDVERYRWSGSCDPAILLILEEHLKAQLI